MAGTWYTSQNISILVLKPFLGAGIEIVISIQPQLSANNVLFHQTVPRVDHAGTIFCLYIFTKELLYVYVEDGATWETSAEKYWIAFMIS